MAAKAQFSLRMIFVVTAVVAVFAAEAVGFPEWLAEIAGRAITMLLPSAFVAQIVYARGPGRTFGIGALSTWSAGLGMTRFNLPVYLFDNGQMDFVIFWLVTLSGGGLAVLVRWFIISK